MRTKEEFPWYLQDIIGFEDDDDGDADDASDDTDDEEEENEDESDDDSSDDDGDDTDEDEDDDEDEKSKKPPKKSENIAGLKSALRKERFERKKLEKQVKKLTEAAKPPKKEEENKDDKGENKDEAESKPDDGKSVKLAAKLQRSAVDTLIIKHAGSDFHDLDAVLTLINRKEIDVDQDEDDPSEIEVDEESVKDAIKALRKAHPYLINKGAGGKPPAGSKFGGTKKKKAELTDEKLRQKYAALRR